MTPDNVRSSETAIVAWPRWQWMVSASLALLAAVLALVDGEAWIGVGLLVGAMAQAIAWYRRVGVFHDGESLIMRGHFKMKRVPIDSIRDLGVTASAGPSVLADPEWSSGPLVLFMSDGTETTLWPLPSWRRQYGRATDAIREWFDQVRSQADAR